MSIPWPKSAPRHHNGANVPCDTWVGPCACGVWHRLGEFETHDGILYRYHNPIIRKVHDGDRHDAND